MNEITKWIQQNQNTLESALTKAQGSGLKAELLHALEVGRALENEAKALPEVETYDRAVTPDRMLASCLSESVSRASLQLSQRLNDTAEDKQRVLLKKLVAAQDQILYRLREFL